MGKPATRVALRIGNCGFGVAQAEYYRALDCVEIDSSFYNLPRLATAARWRASAPEGFAFTLKAWQVITHPPTSPTYRRTQLENGDREHCGRFGFNPTIRWAWEQTYAVAQALEAAVVLFQCPASFRPAPENLARLRQFFERAKRGRLRFAWEPRGEWDGDQVGALCRELDLIHAVDPFQQPAADRGKVRYYRLHGVTGTAHRFSAAELAQLQQRCAERAATWCFFNNVSGFADAVRFRRMVEG